MIPPPGKNLSSPFGQVFIKNFAVEVPYTGMYDIRTHEVKRKRVMKRDV